MKKLAVLLSVVFMLSGCGNMISQSEYDALATEKAELAAQLEDLNSKVAELTDENEKLTSEKENLTSEKENLKSDIEKLREKLETADDFEYNYCANLNSGKFHKANCRYLPASHNQRWYESRQECIDNGYVPCKVCNP